MDADAIISRLFKFEILGTDGAVAVSGLWFSRTLLLRSLSVTFEAERVPGNFLRARRGFSVDSELHSLRTVHHAVARDASHRPPIAARQSPAVQVPSPLLVRRQVPQCVQQVRHII